MMRLFIAIGTLAALPLAAGAGETVVRLKVQPMAAPQPVLKYVLLPEVRELNPGNPAQYYLRCFMEQRNFFFRPGGVQLRTRYQSLPLAQLATEKVSNYGGHALRQVDWAARLDALDWEMTERVQTEGVELALPELGPLRVLAGTLQARFRVEIAQRRFDDAVQTAKTMFAFARHLGEHPAESANAVGLFAAGLAVDTLEEMLQQPDCPNLYWALTNLPHPLVDLQKGLQGSCALAATELRPIRADLVMSEEELGKVVSRLSGVMGFDREQSGRAPRGLRRELAARLKDAEKVRAGREQVFAARRAALLNRPTDKESVRGFMDRLLEMTAAREQSNKMSPLQVVLLTEKRTYEMRRDERMKLLGLTPWQIDALASEQTKDSEDGLFAELLPRVIPARRAQAHLEQRLALLRHVEALRLHAAGHEGKWPDRLSDLAVPLPDDPFTGKPFAYQRDGASAQLHGQGARGENKTLTYVIRCEAASRK